MTPRLMRGTGTVKRGRGEGWRKEGGRGPIDVGAVQVVPLIAPQRVQLCGPSAITAHSARHLTPPVPPPPLPSQFPASILLLFLLPTSSPGVSSSETNQPTRFCPVPARDISLGWTGAIVSFYLNAPRERVDVHRPECNPRGRCDLIRCRVGDATLRRNLLMSDCERFRDRDERRAEL